MKRKKDCTSCVNCLKLHPKNTNIWWLCDINDWRIDRPDTNCCDKWCPTPYKNKFSRASINKKIAEKEMMLGFEDYIQF